MLRNTIFKRTLRELETEVDKGRGGLIAAVIGDMTGCPYEFLRICYPVPPKALAQALVEQGHVLFHLEKGHWSDDGAQTLSYIFSLMESILANGPLSEDREEVQDWFLAGLFMEVMFQWETTGFFSGLDHKFPKQSVGKGEGFITALNCWHELHGDNEIYLLSLANTDSVESIVTEFINLEKPVLVKQEEQYFLYALEEGKYKKIEIEKKYYSYLKSFPFPKPELKNQVPTFKKTPILSWINYHPDLTEFLTFLKKYDPFLVTEPDPEMQPREGKFPDPIARLLVYKKKYGLENRPSDGNAATMRNGPTAIFARTLHQAMRLADLQARTTSGGDEAAACAQLQAYLIYQATHSKLVGEECKNYLFSPENLANFVKEFEKVNRKALPQNIKLLCASKSIHYQTLQFVTKKPDQLDETTIAVQRFDKNYFIVYRFFENGIQEKKVPINNISGDKKTKKELKEILRLVEKPLATTNEVKFIPEILKASYWDLDWLNWRTSMDQYQLGAFKDMTYYGSYSLHGWGLLSNILHNTRSLAEALDIAAKAKGDADSNCAALLPLLAAIYKYQAIPQELIDRANIHRLSPRTDDPEKLSSFIERALKLAMPEAYQLVDKYKNKLEVVKRILANAAKNKDLTEAEIKTARLSCLYLLKHEHSEEAKRLKTSILQLLNSKIDYSNSSIFTSEEKQQYQYDPHYFAESSKGHYIYEEILIGIENNTSPSQGYQLYTADEKTLIFWKNFFLYEKAWDDQFNSEQAQNVLFYYLETLEEDHSKVAMTFKCLAFSYLQGQDLAETRKAIVKHTDDLHGLLNKILTVPIATQDRIRLGIGEENCIKNGEDYHLIHYQDVLTLFQRRTKRTSLEKNELEQLVISVKKQEIKKYGNKIIDNFYFIPEKPRALDVVKREFAACDYFGTLEKTHQRYDQKEIEYLNALEENPRLKALTEIAPDPILPSSKNEEILVDTRPNNLDENKDQQLIEKYKNLAEAEKTKVLNKLFERIRKIKNEDQIAKNKKYLTILWLLRSANDKLAETLKNKIFNDVWSAYSHYRDEIFLFNQLSEKVGNSNKSSIYVYLYEEVVLELGISTNPLNGKGMTINKAVDWGNAIWNDYKTRYAQEDQTRINDLTVMLIEEDFTINWKKINNFFTKKHLQIDIILEAYEEIHNLAEQIVNNDANYSSETIQQVTEFYSRLMLYLNVNDKDIERIKIRFDKKNNPILDQNVQDNVKKIKEILTLLKTASQKDEKNKVVAIKGWIKNTDQLDQALPVRIDTELDLEENPSDHLRLISKSNKIFTCNLRAGGGPTGQYVSHPLYSPDIKPPRFNSRVRLLWSEYDHKNPFNSESNIRYQEFFEKYIDVVNKACIAYQQYQDEVELLFEEIKSESSLENNLEIYDERFDKLTLSYTQNHADILKTYHEYEKMIEEVNEVYEREIKKNQISHVSVSNRQEAINLNTALNQLGKDKSGKSFKSIEELKKSMLFDQFERLYDECTNRNAEDIQKLVNDHSIQVVLLQESSGKRNQTIQNKLGKNWAYTDSTKGSEGLITTFYNSSLLETDPSKQPISNFNNQYRIDYFINKKTKEKVAYCNIHLAFRNGEHQQFEEILLEITGQMLGYKGYIGGDANVDTGEGLCLIPPDYRFHKNDPDNLMPAPYRHSDIIYTVSPEGELKVPDITVYDFNNKKVSIPPLPTNEVEEKAYPSLPKSFLSDLNNSIADRNKQTFEKIINNIHSALTQFAEPTSKENREKLTKLKSSITMIKDLGENLSRNKLSTIVEKIEQELQIFYKEKKYKKPSKYAKKINSSKDKYFYPRSLAAVLKQNNVSWLMKNTEMKKLIEEIDTSTINFSVPPQSISETQTKSEPGSPNVPTFNQDSKKLLCIDRIICRGLYSSANQAQQLQTELEFFNQNSLESRKLTKAFKLYQTTIIAEISKDIYDVDNKDKVIEMIANITPEYRQSTGNWEKLNALEQIKLPAVIVDSLKNLFNQGDSITQLELEEGQQYIEKVVENNQKKKLYTSQHEHIRSTLIEWLAQFDPTKQEAILNLGKPIESIASSRLTPENNKIAAGELEEYIRNIKPFTTAFKSAVTSSGQIDITQLKEQLAAIPKNKDFQALIQKSNEVEAYRHSKKSLVQQFNDNDHLDFYWLNDEDIKQFEGISPLSLEFLPERLNEIAEKLKKGEENPFPITMIVNNEINAKDEQGNHWITIRIDKDEHNKIKIDIIDSNDGYNRVYHGQPHPEAKVEENSIYIWKDVDNTVCIKTNEGTEKITDPIPVSVQDFLANPSYSGSAQFQLICDIGLRLPSRPYAQQIQEVQNISSKEKKAIALRKCLHDAFGQSTITSRGLVKQRVGYECGYLSLLHANHLRDTNPVLKAAGSHFLGYQQNMSNLRDFVQHTVISKEIDKGKLSVNANRLSSLYPAFLSQAEVTHEAKIANSTDNKTDTTPPTSINAGVNPEVVTDQPQKKETTEMETKGDQGTANTDSAVTPTQTNEGAKSEVVTQQPQKEDPKAAMETGDHVTANTDSTRKKRGWVERFRVDYAKDKKNTSDGLTSDGQVDKFFKKFDELFQMENPPKYVVVTYSSNGTHTHDFFAAERKQEVLKGLTGKHQAVVVNKILKKLHTTHRHYLHFVKFAPITTLKQGGKKAQAEAENNIEELRRAEDHVKQGAVLLAWANQDCDEIPEKPQAQDAKVIDHEQEEEEQNKDKQYYAIGGGKAGAYQHHQLVQSTLRKLEAAYPKPAGLMSVLPPADNNPVNLQNVVNRYTEKLNLLFQENIKKINPSQTSPDQLQQLQKIMELFDNYKELIKKQNFAGKSAGDLNYLRNHLNSVAHRIKNMQSIDAAEKIKRIFEVIEIGAQAFYGIQPKLASLMQALKYEIEWMDEYKKTKENVTIPYLNLDKNTAQKYVYSSTTLTKMLHQKTPAQQAWIISAILPTMERVADDKIINLLKKRLKTLAPAPIATPFRDFLGYYLSRCMEYVARHENDNKKWFSNERDNKIDTSHILCAMTMARQLAHCAQSREGLKKLGEEARGMLAILDARNSTHTTLIELLKSISNKEAEYRWRVELPAKNVIEYANYNDAAVMEKNQIKAVGITMNREKKKEMIGILRDYFTNTELSLELIRIAKEIKPSPKENSTNRKQHYYLSQELARYCAMVQLLIDSKNPQEHRIGLKLVQKITPEVIEKMKTNQAYQDQKFKVVYPLRAKLIENFLSINPKKKFDNLSSEMSCRLAGFEAALREMKSFDSITFLRDEGVLPEKPVDPSGNNQLFVKSAYYRIQHFLTKLTVQETRMTTIQTKLFDTVLNLFSDNSLSNDNPIARGKALETQYESILKTWSETLKKQETQFFGRFQNHRLRQFIEDEIKSLDLSQKTITNKIT